MFTDERNLKVIGLDEEEKVVWARVLRKWFPPVASSHICSCCFLIDKASWTLCNPVYCSPPASSVHGVSLARTLEWVAISFPRASSRPRDQTWASCIGRQVLYHWAMWEQSLHYNPGSYKLYIIWIISRGLVPIIFHHRLNHRSVTTRNQAGIFKIGKTQVMQVETWIRS